MLFNIKFYRLVDRIGNVFAVFLALLDALGQKIFDLPVDRTEIILRPRSYGIVQLCRKAQRDLLFLCHRSVQTARIDDGLRVLAAAEHDEQVRYHGGLALFIELDDVAVA